MKNEKKEVKATETGTPLTDEQMEKVNGGSRRIVEPEETEEEVGEELPTWDM